MRFFIGIDPPLFHLNLPSLGPIYNQGPVLSFASVVPRPATRVPLSLTLSLHRRSCPGSSPPPVSAAPDSVPLFLIHRSDSLVTTDAPPLLVPWCPPRFFLFFLLLTLRPDSAVPPGTIPSITTGCMASTEPVPSSMSVLARVFSS